MLAFLQNSITNHISYLKISDTSLKHFYVIQFEGLKGRSSDIAIQLQQIVEFNYKNATMSTSLSKDGEYKKINGVILTIKKSIYSKLNKKQFKYKYCIILKTTCQIILLIKN